MKKNLLKILVALVFSYPMVVSALTGDEIKAALGLNGFDIQFGTRDTDDKDVCSYCELVSSVGKEKPREGTQFLKINHSDYYNNIFYIKPNSPIVRTVSCSDSPVVA